MSALCFVLMLLIFISIPTLIYTIFYILRCPPNTFRISSSTAHPPPPLVNGCGKAAAINRTELVTVVVVSKSEDTTEDCPVCLSAFDDGEEIWQLKLCKHLFHAPCIQRWLHARSSCPVCRAYVVSPKTPTPAKLCLPGSQGLV